MDNISVGQKARRSIRLTAEMTGPGTVFLSQNWKFTAPVFIGNTIMAEAEVLFLHATKPVMQLKLVVTRQNEETVLEGEAWCYTFNPKSPDAS